MKIVLTALLLLYSAHPVQAVACEMQDPQGPGQHSTMHDSPMNDEGGEMDCCDHEPEQADPGCNAFSYCGASMANVVALQSSISSLTIESSGQQDWSVTDSIPSRYSPPPLRPPTA